MRKKVILLTIMLIILSLTSCQQKPDEFQLEYPQLTDPNHLYEVVDASWVISILTNAQNEHYQKPTIVVFGFKACPWCQAVIPYINEVAKAKNFEKVYYVDIKDMRDNPSSSDHERYLTIKEKLAGVVDETKDRINAPTVVVLKQGEVLSYHLDTVPSHQLNDNRILPPLTKVEEDELRQIFEGMFEIS